MLRVESWFKDGPLRERLLMVSKLVQEGIDLAHEKGLRNEAG